MTAVSAQAADLIGTASIDPIVSPNGATELLNSAELSRLIRVPEATLRYWRHIGIGPKSFKMGPRRVLYLASDVTSWVAEQYANQR